MPLDFALASVDSVYQSIHKAQILRSVLGLRKLDRCISASYCIMNQTNQSGCM